MLFIGLDGGGTSTRALATDETGAVLGRGKAGPGNPLSVGWEPAVAAIIAAVRATRVLLPVDAAFFGLAGVGREPAKSRMTAALAEARLARRFEVGIDVEIALAGAHGGEPGGIVCAGTGAIALARAADGTLHRADGWGHLLGDEGSGYWIGLEALRKVFRDADGRLGCPEPDDAPSALGTAILAHFGLQSLSELVTRVYETPLTPAEVAALAPVVAACAKAGDTGADATLMWAGWELAHAGIAVLRAADMRQGPLSYTGGVFRLGRPLLTPFKQHVRQMLPGVVIRAPQMSPVAGAALLARQLLTPES